MTKTTLHNRDSLLDSLSLSSELIYGNNFIYYSVFSINGLYWVQHFYQSCDINLPQKLIKKMFHSLFPNSYENWNKAQYNFPSSYQKCRRQGVYHIIFLFHLSNQALPCWEKKAHKTSVIDQNWVIWQASRVSFFVAKKDKCV